MLVVLLQASARDPQLAARLRPVIWMLLLATCSPPHPSLAGRRPRG